MLKLRFPSAKRDRTRLVELALLSWCLIVMGCSSNSPASVDAVGSGAGDAVDGGVSSADAAEDVAVLSDVGIPLDAGLSDAGLSDAGALPDGIVSPDAASDGAVQDTSQDTGPAGCEIMSVSAIDAHTGCHLGDSVLGCFSPDFNGQMGCLKSKDGKVIFSTPTTSIIPDLIKSGAYIACELEDDKTLLNPKVCAGLDATGDTVSQPDVQPDVLPAG